MKKIILPLIALALTCGLAFAEEGVGREPILPAEVKAQVEAARVAHHQNIVSERTRFRAELEKILANHPDVLAKMKEHWAKMDKMIENRQEHRQDKREDRQDKREDRRENRQERHEHKIRK